MHYDYDLIVIGGGPAGCAAAEYAGNNGLKTALIEKKNLGGTCLNVGCIPTKAYIRSAEIMKTSMNSAKSGVNIENVSCSLPSVRKSAFEGVAALKKGIEYLLKKNSVDVIKGSAEFISQNSVRINNDEKKEIRSICAKNIIVAIGSLPRELKELPLNGRGILTSDDLFDLDSLPESITIVGGGVVGVEYAYVFNAFGVRTILVEVQKQILPEIDREVAKTLERNFKKTGIEVLTGSIIETIENNGSEITLTINIKGNKQKRNSNLVLSAVGRMPGIEGLNIESLGIHTERGFITVNKHLETSVPHIYAVGDCINTPMLAHVASEEGVNAVKSIRGESSTINYNNIPFATYNHPQVALCGYTEQSAEDAGYNVLIGKSFFRANGMAVTMNETEGFVKILCNRDDYTILGACIIGESAAELIHEIVLARNAGFTVHDIADIVHAHPTLSETIREACRNII